MNAALLLWATLLPASAAGERQTADGYSFERPADWRLESFTGGFFLRSPQFGGGIIIGHTAAAPADAAGLEALTVETVNGLMNVRSRRITDRGKDRAAGRDGFTVRFDGLAAGGQELKAILTALPMPNGRVLSVFLRAIPPARFAEWEPVHRRLLDSLRFDEGVALEQAAVRAAFAEYKKRLLSGRTWTWPSLVSQRTVDYYGRARQRALEATEAEVRALPLPEKLLVLTLRHRLEPQQLRDWTAKRILDHAFRQGWIDKASVADGEIGSVEIDGDHARAQFRHSGQRVPYDMELRREDGRWKVDLVPLLVGAAPALRRLAAEQQWTEDELIVRLLEQGTSKQVSPAIWKPSGAATP
jgi:hypothetical protein